MASKTDQNQEEAEVKEKTDDKESEIEKLNEMLAAVLNYISDDEIEEIDFEYLLNHTEGLLEWWDTYQERNRKVIVAEIKKSLGNLPLKKLELIHEQMKDQSEIH
jgi:hypothetical protein